MKSSTNISSHRIGVFLDMLPKSKDQLHNIVRLLLIVLVSHTLISISFYRFLTLYFFFFFFFLFCLFVCFFQHKVVCVGYDGRARRLLQLFAASLKSHWHPVIGGGVRRDEEEVAQLLLATAEVTPKNTIFK